MYLEKYKILNTNNKINEFDTVEDMINHYLETLDYFRKNYKIVNNIYFYK